MGNSRKSRTLLGVWALLLLGALLTVLAIGSSVASAETGTKALILGSSVTGGAASREATNAIGNGFTVDVVTDATWGGMTAAQFADYQMIIVGDPTCSTLPAVVSQNAAALADAVMARAGGNTKVGNRILIGTDPVFHFSQGGDKLVETGIDFAGVQEGASGLYLDFSCFDPDYDGNGVPDGQDKLLPLLTADPTGTWTQNQSPPCGGDVSLISNAAQFSSLTSEDLRGWGCSVHETFPTFPTDWTALAIATDTATAPTCGTDVDTGEPRCGEAYILISGSGIVVESPNLSLDPTTDTNPVGSQHTVTATVTNPNGSPRSGVEVSFVVTGANAGATGTCVPADCTTGADGEVTFTYTGTNVGDDTINAAITVDGSRQTATAAKTWTAVDGGDCFEIVDVTGSYVGNRVKVHITYAAPTCPEFVYDAFVYNEAGDTAPIAGQGQHGNGAPALDFGGTTGMRVGSRDPDGDVVVCAVVWSGTPHTAENVLDQFGYPNAPDSWACHGLELNRTT